ncbi:uncharacterized protein METZ01_LOCUS2589, partial [marine metagenome]
VAVYEPSFCLVSPLKPCEFPSNKRFVKVRSERRPIYGSAFDASLVFEGPQIGLIPLSYDPIEIE